MAGPAGPRPTPWYSLPLMLTLTRRIGERILIGDVTVEVVAASRYEVTLRLHNVDESAVEDLNEPMDPHPAPARRRVVPPKREETPLIIETRRSRKT